MSEGLDESIETLRGERIFDVTFHFQVGADDHSVGDRKRMSDCGGRHAASDVHRASWYGVSHALCMAQVGCLTGGPARWTYVYGDMDPDTQVEEILTGVRAYAQTTDGIVPWRERPQAFRKQSIARIPPQE